MEQKHEYYNKNISPEGGIFLSKRFKTPHYLLERIEQLPAIYEASTRAKSELTYHYPSDASLKEYKFLRDQFLMLPAFAQQPIKDEVHHTERLLEDAGLYDDVRAAISCHGGELAYDIASMMPEGRYNIGSSQYEVGIIHGVNVLLRDESMCPERILYNWWQNPPNKTRLADWGDHICLIRDVDMARTHQLYAAS